MEDMDIDQVVEVVPDIPDRPTARDVVAGDLGGKEINLSVAGHFQNFNFLDEESLNQPRIRGRLGSGNGHNRRLNLHQSSCSFDKTEQFSNPIYFHPEDSRHGSPNAASFRRTPIDKNYKHETRNNGGSHGDSGKQTCFKVPSKSLGFLGDRADLTEMSRCAQMPEMVLPRGKTKDLSEKEKREGHTAANGCSSHWPLNFPKMPVCFSKEKEKIGYDTNKGANSFSHHGNVIDLSGGGQHENPKQTSASRHSLHSPRFNRKRLVRNGCISPHNIESKAKQLAEHSRNCSEDVDHNCYVDVVSSGPYTVDTGDLVAEDNARRTSKGKMIHPGMCQENGKKISHLSSSSAANHREVNANGHAGARRTTHNHSKEVDDSLPDLDGLHSGRHDDLDQRSKAGQVGNAVIKRQKKDELTSINLGQSSQTICEDSDIVYLGSSGESSSRSRPARTQSRRNQCIMSSPEFSPEMRDTDSQGLDYCSNDDSEAIARQLEADEILAFELQEQLYHESPLFGSSQIDEDLARVLQQEEDGFHSSIQNHNLLQSRNTSSSNRQHQARVLPNAPNRRGAQTQVQNSAGMTRFRSRFLNRSRAAHSRGRNLSFPLEMDLDMRLDFLEALEAAFGDLGDMETAENFPQFQHEFNEDDYEMLLALDDNIPQSGASANQINRLPMSTVQTDNFEEACAICLDTPASGDSIRHLPCLHKFHKDCIDSWLSHRPLCPVCKSPIT